MMMAWKADDPEAQGILLALEKDLRIGVRWFWFGYRVINREIMQQHVVGMLIMP